MAAEREKCMILGAVPLESGKIFREFDPKEHFVICADAGWETAQKYQIAPDLIVGDFDSAKRRPPAGAKVVTLPVEKDVTDTMYAVQKGLARGYREFVLLGCLGGARFDHSLANLEVLEYLREHGAHGVLADERTKIFLLRGGLLRLTGLKGAGVSVFPYRGPSCTVSYAGLRYPLSRGTLTCGGVDPMGVSNSVVGDPAEIRVHLGTALVVVTQE